MFLAFDTNLTESIKTMFVSGNDLLICGNHVYNHYRDCKDIGSYLCGDTIVDVAALCPNNVSLFLLLLLLIFVDVLKKHIDFNCFFLSHFFLSFIW